MSANLRSERRRRIALVALSALGLGVAPLACELTTDLDKLRGPSANGGGGAGGGKGGETSMGGQTSATDGGGGQEIPPPVTIFYASAADIDALHYEPGLCDDALWKAHKAETLHWSSEQYHVTADCQLAWTPKGKARTVIGCCEVQEPSVAPANINGPCVTYGYDGLEYLFAKTHNDGATNTAVILSAWGDNCTKKPVVTVKVNGDPDYTRPDKLSCFTPLNTGHCADSASASTGFALKWKLDADPSFTTDEDEVFCTLGVRSVLLPMVDKSRPGQLTLHGIMPMSKSDGWSSCKFEPAPDAG